MLNIGSTLQRFSLVHDHGIRLDVRALLASGTLPIYIAWGVALSAALAARAWDFAGELLASARAEGVSDAILSDAQVAATLMAMDVMHCQIRHQSAGRAKDRRTRGQRLSSLSRPASDARAFALFALAAGIMNGCAICGDADRKELHGEGHIDEREALRIATVVAEAASAAGFPDP
ncbi:MAG: hypothetical protein H0V44_06780 [Planctomycetes bacterium]|nr:hypothetical protein [Planctomycetota bacterium]